MGLMIVGPCSPFTPPLWVPPLHQPLLVSQALSPLLGSAFGVVSCGHQISPSHLVVLEQHGTGPLL